MTNSFAFLFPAARTPLSSALSRKHRQKLRQKYRHRLLAGLLCAGLFIGSGSGCQPQEEPRYLDVLDMSSSDGDSANSGLPCEVSQVFSKTCTACHSSSASGLPKLLTYADVTTSSAVDPSKKIIERAIARMQDPARPMPPSGLAPASEVAVLQAWLNAGTPKGSCGQSP